MENLIEYTNARIKAWYSNVEKEFGIIGSGKVRFTDDTVIVDYIEDGEQKTWSMPFYPEYFQTKKIDWVFNCWAELV